MCENNKTKLYILYSQTRIFDDKNTEGKDRHIGRHFKKRGINYHKFYKLVDYDKLLTILFSNIYFIFNSN